jgi:RNA polymerase sigma-70 factor (ECF subfamily)
LLASLNHFLANERQRNGAVKRGGHLEILSLDDAQAEARYAVEPASQLTPEKAYERQGAQALLDHALKRLADEFSTAGKTAHFQCLREFLQCEESELSYAQVGSRLGLKPSAVASAVYRLRQRYRELVRQEIAHTLPDSADLEEELHWLFAALC